ncbi:ATP-binding protein [Streptomyces parvulus]|uniref:ATP-binding protein n=1 Tax=Streptomyces parvulus TaxID=146923 RepID=A0A191V799_9ACTN|nr:MULTISPECIES: ATP-binding protein [Streptomyces]ANJ10901.1 ATPase [Streptomyces parvulus]MCC9156276.1 ATP-binding protein [Streptomyces parvulus]MCE7689412.1 ATP-binding protein [Streptomyces parvulus]MCQ4194138.1 ATP-binding protein [Streptomyces parvulus]MZD57278.1 ATP-binding protein [Streptomyces sp. SID5606]
MTPAHGPDAADASAVSTVVEFTGGSAMIPASRDVVHRFVAHLAELGVAPADTFLDTARLVASELVTNALRHAPGPCRLALTLVGDRVEIAVSDTGDGFPTFLPRDPVRVGRHGLEIVTRLCGEVITRPHTKGKTVYARLPLT